MREKNSPPPYSSAGQGPSQHPAAIEADALLDQLIEWVNKQHVLGDDYPPGAQAIVDRETERIRNMLEFTLAVDYQGCSTATMTVADREHFVHITKALGGLRSTTLDERSSQQVSPDPAERQVLAAYFWKYLFEPCKTLSLPLDFVYENIYALSIYTLSNGGYKGAVFGLLQQRGVARLAEKLYRDKHILIPLIFTDDATRDRMLHELNAIQELYFHSIDRIESSTLPYPSLRNFQTFQVLKYEANERGIVYASTRRAAIARGCKELSTKYWTSAVGRCVDSILARFKLVKNDDCGIYYSDPAWRGEEVDTYRDGRHRGTAVPVG